MAWYSGINVDFIARYLTPFHLISHRAEGRNILLLQPALSILGISWQMKRSAPHIAPMEPNEGVLKLSNVTMESDITIARCKTRWECYIFTDQSDWVSSLVEKYMIPGSWMTGQGPCIQNASVAKGNCTEQACRTESRPNVPRYPIRVSELQCAWTKCGWLSPATLHLASMECDIWHSASWSIAPISRVQTPGNDWNRDRSIPHGFKLAHLHSVPSDSFQFNTYAQMSLPGSFWKPIVKSSWLIWS